MRFKLIRETSYVLKYTKKQNQKETTYVWRSRALRLVARPVISQRSHVRLNLTQKSHQTRIACDIYSAHRMITSSITLLLLCTTVQSVSQALHFPALWVERPRSWVSWAEVALPGRFYRAAHRIPAPVGVRAYSSLLRILLSHFAFQVPCGIGET